MELRGIANKYPDRYSWEALIPDILFLLSPSYSKVPNNSAARLLIFEIFSYQHGLIWT